MAEGVPIEEFKKKVEALLTNLPAEIQRINDGIALSIIPEIKTRIRNKGVDGKGKSFGNYSTNPLPTFFFTHKGTGSGADTRLEALIKKKKKAEGKSYKGVSYTEFRTINSKPTEHVTLSFTDETLNDIGVINNRHEGQIIVTTVGAMNTKTKAKYDSKGVKTGENTTEQILDFLGERYGDNILSVNEDEESEMAEVLDDELQLLIDKYIG
jgi:hypothetical protein